MSAAQAQAQAQAQAATLRKRRYERLQDASIPECALFNRLVVAERRLDELLARYRRDIEDASAMSLSRVSRTFRLCLSHHFEPAVPAAENTPAKPAQIAVRLEGFAVPTPSSTSSTGTGAAAAAAAAAAASAASSSRFSQYFRRATVQFAFPGHPIDVVQWSSAHEPAPVDGLQVTRAVPPDVPPGSRVAVTVTLPLESHPPRLKLAPALAQLLGVTTETRGRVVALLYQLARTKRAVDPADPAVIVCDEALAAALGAERLQPHELLARLEPLLQPLDPVTLACAVPVYPGPPPPPPPGARGLDPTVAEVTIDAEDAAAAERAAAFLARVQPEAREVAALDEQLAERLEQVDERRKRVAFMRAAARSPGEFLCDLIASQARDLKVVRGETLRADDAERRADYFSLPHVEEAIARYLNGLSPMLAGEPNLTQSPYMQLYRFGLTRL